jgi:hypothetical protein
MACVIVPRYHLADSKPSRLLRFWRLILPGSASLISSNGVEGPCNLVSRPGLAISRTCVGNWRFLGVVEITMRYLVASPSLLAHSRLPHSHTSTDDVSSTEDPIATPWRSSRKLLYVSQATKLRPWVLSRDSLDRVPQNLLPNVDAQDSMPARP